MTHRIGIVPHESAGSPGAWEKICAWAADFGEAVILVSQSLDINLTPRRGRQTSRVLLNHGYLYLSE